MPGLVETMLEILGVLERKLDDESDH